MYVHMRVKEKIARQQQDNNGYTCCVHLPLNYENKYRF